jgi:hypothetical protein
MGGMHRIKHVIIRRIAFKAPGSLVCRFRSVLPRNAARFIQPLYYE